MMGWKILVPFITTKVFSPNWDLAKYSFVHLELSSSYGPVAKYILNSDAGNHSSYPACKFYYFFITTSLVAPVRSRAQASYLFHNSFRDYIPPKADSSILL